MRTSNVSVGKVGRGSSGISVCSRAARGVPSELSQLLFSSPDEYRSILCILVKGFFPPANGAPVPSSTASITSPSASRSCKYNLEFASETAVEIRSGETVSVELSES